MIMISMIFLPEHVCMYVHNEEMCYVHSVLNQQ